MPPPLARHRPPATALYVGAGVAAGIVAGVLHIVVPAALEALEGAAAAAHRRRASAATTSAACRDGGAPALADEQAEEASPVGSALDALTHWLTGSKVGEAAAAVLSLAAAKAGGGAGRMASSRPAQPASLPARPSAAVTAPPSRLGRIAVGLPSSSPASVVVVAPGAGRYYWKPHPHPPSDPATPRSGPATPGSSCGGGSLRVPASTDSEVVALLRAKLAGEDPPPLTPSSARSDGSDSVPANFTGSRPPLYVSPRAGAPGDDGHAWFGGSPSPY